MSSLPVKESSMSWLNTVGLALALAMDAFAVSIVVGLTIPQLTARHVFRLSWHFGLFQFLMPVAGWLAGQTLESHIASFDHWVAAGLLAVIGGHMLLEAVQLKKAREFNGKDATRGLTMVGLSIATSLDALAVGMSLALMRVSIWGPSVVIGVVAGVMTLVGITFGNRIGARFGRWAAVAGGAILLVIAVRLVVAHTAG
jgi:putative Mn2+ efflux pump MntP